MTLVTLKANPTGSADQDCLLTIDGVCEDSPSWTQGVFHYLHNEGYVNVIAAYKAASFADQLTGISGDD